MESNDKVIANIIADSQETVRYRDTLNRRQFLTQLAAGVGGIGGALSTLPAFAQLSSGQLQPDTPTERYPLRLLLRLSVKRCGKTISSMKML